MPNELTTERLRELLAICEKAVAGDARAIVEFVDKFDPVRCAALVRDVLELRARLADHNPSPFEYM